MPVAILTPSSNPISARTGAWTCSSFAETLDRIATIVRKYATDSVAIREDRVEASLRGDGPFACSLQEAARRLGVIASSWTGVRVEARLEEESPVGSSSGEPHRPGTVRVMIRAGESHDLRLERIARAAGRLQVLMATQGREPKDWVLRIGREAGTISMPLPNVVFEDATLLARRLPARALEGVNAIELEARVRQAPSRTGGTRNPVRIPRVAALPLVS